MWTIAAVNKKFSGPLGSYNGLTDVHLAHYFSSPFRRSHLKAINLITPDGIIVPEQKVKVESLQYEKKRKIYDILANAVLQNAVQKEGTWNKKLCGNLDDISKMEVVEKVKGLHFKGRHSKLLNSAPSSCLCSYDFEHQKKSSAKRSLSAKEYSPYIASLLLSGSAKFQSQTVLHQTVNSRRKKKRKQASKTKSTSQNSEFKFQNVTEERTPKLLVPELNINQCKITMYYYGHFACAESSKTMKQYVIIRQQHCGGTPVVVYKGNISPNETLSFISLDHDGFSFSITVFLDGIRDLKLSTCCVFRYLPGRRLGGSSGSFAIHKIEGGKPCVKCQYRKMESSSVMGSKSTENILNDTTIDVLGLFSPNYHESGHAFIPSVEKVSAVVLDKEVSKTETKEDSYNSGVEEIEEINESCDIQMPDKSTNEKNIVEVLNSSEEDVKTAEEYSYDSESSVASLSKMSDKMTEPIHFHEVSIDSESSSDASGEKQHVIVGSVHYPPNERK